MEQPALIFYDGSFEGFLTACKSALAQPGFQGELRRSCEGPQGLLHVERLVKSDRDSALELWDALGKKGTALQRLVYFSFLSERPGMERDLLAFVRQVLETGIVKGAPGVGAFPASLVRWAGKVASERRRLEASLRFQNPREGVFAGVIAPEYNVLPLLSRQFRNRFRDTSWLIYDCRRDTVLWGRVGSPLFLESLAHCPSAIRSVVRELHPFPELPWEPAGPGVPVREPRLLRERKAFASPRPGKPHRSYQEAV